MARIQSTHLVILGLGFLAFAPGCENGQPMSAAVGSYSDIAVLTDIATLGPVANQLDRELSKDVEYSIRPEPLFNVDVFDWNDRRNAEVYKNVIVVGLLKGKDPASHELRSRLGGETMSDMGHRNFYVAVKSDVYSRNQLVFFVAGNDRTLMQSGLAKSIDVLIHRIENENRIRLRHFLFTNGHELELENKIRSEMGFSLQVPASYRETRFEKGKKDGLVEVAAVRPTRTASIYYLDDADSTMLDDHDVLLELRRSFGARFLEEDLQDTAGFEWSEEIFAGKMTPVLSGFWQAKTGDYGGPFRTYFLYEAEKRRLYAVTVLTYAPGMQKRPYIREATCVAETLVP